MDHVYTSGEMKIESISITADTKMEPTENTIVEEAVNIVGEDQNIYIKDGEIFDGDMKPVLLKVESAPSTKRRIILKGDLLTFIKEQEKEKEKERALEKATGTPAPQKWTREAINLLISLRTQLSEYFDNPKNKKMDYWAYVSNILTQAGFEITGPECHVKWRNLCCTYRMNMERVHRLGPQAVRWEFFEQMDVCLKNKMTDKMELDENDIEEEDSDDDVEMSRLLKIQSKVTPKPSSSSLKSEYTSPPAKKPRASSPPPWFKEYVQKRDHEEKLRDERFFTILEAIKESELRKTALLETLLQYFDRN